MAASAGTDEKLAAFDAMNALRADIMRADAGDPGETDGLLRRALVEGVRYARLPGWAVSEESEGAADRRFAMSCKADARSELESEGRMNWRRGWRTAASCSALCGSGYIPAANARGWRTSTRNQGGRSRAIWASGVLRRLPEVYPRLRGGTLQRLNLLTATVNPYKLRRHVKRLLTLNETRSIRADKRSLRAIAAGHLVRLNLHTVQFLPVLSVDSPWLPQRS